MKSEKEPWLLIDERSAKAAELHLEVWTALAKNCNPVVSFTLWGNDWLVENKLAVAEIVSRD
jgi:hypothetical protein